MIISRGGERLCITCRHEAQRNGGQSECACSPKAISLVRQVAAHRAKQLRPKPHLPLLYRKNDMAEQLLHEMEDRGTLEEIFLNRENALTVISFFPTCVENQLLLMGCLDGYTLMLRKIEVVLLA